MRSPLQYSRGLSRILLVRRTLGVLEGITDLKDKVIHIKYERKIQRQKILSILSSRSVPHEGQHFPVDVFITLLSWQENRIQVLANAFFCIHQFFTLLFLKQLPPWLDIKFYSIHLSEPLIHRHEELELKDSKHATPAKTKLLTKTENPAWIWGISLATMKRCYLGYGKGRVTETT